MQIKMAFNQINTLNMENNRLFLDRKKKEVKNSEAMDSKGTEKNLANDSFLAFSDYYDQQSPEKKSRFL